MTTPKRNTRGLQDIRTLSGRVDIVSEPYRAYMRISCLEMEKARRGKEKQSACLRLKNIDERFQEIEAEKVALLQNLGQRSTSNSIEVEGGEATPTSRCSRSIEAFKIKY